MAKQQLGECLFLLILTLSEARGESIALTKCCPENEVLDTSTKSCVAADFANEQFSSLYTLEPVWGSHYFLLIDHSDDEASLAALEDSLIPPPHSFVQVGLPQCVEREEQLVYLSSPDNSVLSSDFFVNDDVLEKAPTHALISLVEAGKAYRRFCLDRARRTSNKNFVGTAALVCELRDDVVCTKKICVSRCCPQFEVFVNNRCGPPTHPQPELNALAIRDAEGEEVERERIEMIYDNLPTQCESRLIYDHFHIDMDGRAVREDRILNTSHYCVERFEVSSDASKAVDLEFERLSTLSYPFKLVMCETSDVYARGYLLWQRLVDFTLVPLLFLVSLVFLALLAIVVYVRNRHKLFGAMTLCLVCMLFLFYLGLLLTKIAGHTLLEKWPTLCLSSALVIQFAYLSAVFWLNAMSFDIWRSFRRMQAAPHINRPRQGWRHPRFKWLALYSWLGPLFIVLVTLLMQLLPPSLLSFVVRPSIGTTRCFLHQRWAMVAYLHVFVAPLLVSNLLFFGLSTFNLCCGLWADKKGDPQMRAQQKSRFVTVTKMFFAMGITWLAETASLVLEWSYGRSNVVSIVSIFSIINSLQGVILFLVIVCEPNTIRRCKARILGTNTNANNTNANNNTNNNNKEMSSVTRTTTLISSLRSRVAKMSRRQKDDEAIEMDRVIGKNDNNDNNKDDNKDNNKDDNKDDNEHNNEENNKDNKKESKDNVRDADYDEPDAIVKA